MQTIQRRILLNTLDIAHRTRLGSLLYSRGLFSFVCLYGAYIERDSMGYYDTTSNAWLYIGLLFLPIKRTSVQLNDSLCALPIRPSTRKKLLLSMILLCFVSITCVNSLKCCNYVTPGVIRYSIGGYVNIYFSMGPYTLW